jgi:hypothetical protein
MDSCPLGSNGVMHDNMHDKMGDNTTTNLNEKRTNLNDSKTRMRAKGFSLVSGKRNKQVSKQEVGSSDPPEYLAKSASPEEVFDILKEVG